MAGRHRKPEVREHAERDQASLGATQKRMMPERFSVRHCLDRTRKVRNTAFQLTDGEAIQRMPWITAEYEEPAKAACTPVEDE